MKLRFIDDWRQSYKLGSVQLAAAIGVLATILAANPGFVLGLIGMLPAGPMRTVAAIGVGAIVFVIPWLTRVLKKEPTDKPNA